MQDLKIDAKVLRRYLASNGGADALAEHIGLGKTKLYLLTKPRGLVSCGSSKTVAALAKLKLQNLFFLEYRSHSQTHRVAVNIEIGDEACDGSA